jgi:hypothetical protein
MKPFYTYIKGIKLWENANLLVDENFVTISLVGQKLEDIYSCWVDIYNMLRINAPNIFKWLTTAVEFDGSKVQEIKLLKKFQKELQIESIFDKKKDNIYYYIEKISLNPINIDLNTLTAYKYTGIIFMSNQHEDLNNIWDIFGYANKGLTPLIAYDILNKLPGSIICRVYEDIDTHVVIQYIAKLADIKDLLPVLHEKNIYKVSDELVSDHINNRI